MGSKKPSELSLILVPATPSMVRVGRDMARLGKTLMVSYAVDAPADSPFLHIWDGESWIPVPGDKYSSGAFVVDDVRQVVVVGQETDQTATLIEEALVWCPEVLHMQTDNVTQLLNQLGKVYGLNTKEWEWIAERYQLQLDNLTKDTPRSNWYDTHTPRDVPVTDPPWRRKKGQASSEAPATSLTPMEE